VFDFSTDEVQRAVQAVRTNECGSHRDALERYLPQIFSPYIENSFSEDGTLPLGEGTAVLRTDTASPLGGGFRAAVFNLEQGARIAPICAYFTHCPALRDVSVVFANELDWGMARTGNASIPQEFAGAGAFNYAFGVEFLSAAAWKNGNERGLHGNGVFSRFPLDEVKVVSLPIKYEWFYKEGDCRLGMRNAVLARAKTPEGYLGLVSVHLENRATPQARREQFAFLLDQVEAHFGDLPVLIGGDLNTNTVDGNDEAQMLYLADHPGEMWRRIGQVPSWEPLLDYAASRGFSWADCNIPEKTTRRKPMDDGRTVALNLDWFFQRGLRCSNPVKIESIFHKNGLVDPSQEILAFQGQEMSDHDIVLISCEVSP